MGIQGLVECQYLRPVGPFEQQMTCGNCSFDLKRPQGIPRQVTLQKRLAFGDQGAIPSVTILACRRSKVAVSVPFNPSPAMKAPYSFKNAVKAK